MSFGLGRLGSGFGRLGAGGGKRASYSAAAQAFFDRLATQPTASRKTAYDVMISGLVYANVWPKLDGFYVFAAADAATARTNLVQSSFGATVVGAPTFSADSGYTGTNDATGYLETSFDPTVGSPNYTRNSAVLFTFRETTTVDDVGIVIATRNQHSYIQTYIPDGKYYFAITGGSGSVASFASNLGMYVSGRVDSANVSGYLSGIPVGATPSNSTAITAGKTIRILGDGTIQGSNSRLSAAGFGSGLSSADNRNLFTHVNNFRTTIAGTSPAVTLGFSSDVVNDGMNNMTPGIARLADGRLITAYAVGDGLGAAYPNSKIVHKLSSDNGKTWAAAVDLLIPAASHSYLEPNVTVLASGIILLSTRYATNDGATQNVLLIRGTVAGDLSIAWSAPITITGSEISTSFILKLANGTLLLGLYNALETKVSVIFSADAGLTWNTETTVVTNSGVEAFNESNYIQLANGTILGVLRNDSATASHKGYWTTLSTDNGATWSVPTQVIDNTYATQPARPALSLTPSGKILLVSRFIGPAGALQTGYTYSSDGGATWSTPTIYYNIGSKSYGAHTYAQGFYDAATASLMYAICQGGFTAAQINFQQFYLA